MIAEIDKSISGHDRRIAKANKSLQMSLNAFRELFIDMVYEPAPKKIILVAYFFALIAVFILLRNILNMAGTLSGIDVRRKLRSRIDRVCSKDSH